LISGNTKKFIFFILLSFNLDLIVKAEDSYQKKDLKTSIKKNLIWNKVFYENDKVEPKFLLVKNLKDQKNIENTNIQISEKNKSANINIPNTNLDELTIESEKDNVSISEKNKSATIIPSNANLDELTIESEIQSEKDNILYAEGNVYVSYENKYLRADSLIYDKVNKNIIVKGNINLIVGEQRFKASELEYSFVNKKGFLLDVKGYVNTDKLIDDLYSNFSKSDIQKIEEFTKIQKKEVLNTSGKVENWLFFANRIYIDGETWTSDKALFTNDLLEAKQVKLEINSLEAISKNESLRFKSSFNYLILDEKISFPFWLGERTLTKSSESLVFENRWNFGYDNLDKDGYYIGRRLNSINLFNDFVLDLEPQFLIQRSIKGYTKSFVEKGDHILSEKVKRDNSFEDSFGINSEVQGKLKNWDLAINKKLNTFDFDKFSDAIRIKAKLSKNINFLNSRWEKTFFGVYRDRVWNGSLGEAEIYEGYGSKIEKTNEWEVNGIKKTEKFSMGLGNFKGESFNNKRLVSGMKGSFFYSLDQKIPIFVDYPSNKFIDSSFEYTPIRIEKGLKLATNFSVLYSIYENGSHQSYLGFGVGPEFIFGNLKKKSFDYTRLSLMPSYKLKDGNSMFKFDQVTDQFTLDFAFDQQLYGPLIVKTNATLNLDSDSKDYGDFINSKIALNWQKRSYELGIFYQPHNQAGGVAFKLYGFK